MTHQLITRPSSLKAHIVAALEFDAQKPVHCLPEKLCSNLEFSTATLLQKKWHKMDVIVNDPEFAKVLTTLLKVLMQEVNSKTPQPNTCLTSIKWEETKQKQFVVHVHIGTDQITKLLELVVLNAIVQTLYNTSIHKTRELIVWLHKTAGGVGVQPQSPWFKIFEGMRKRMPDGESGIIFNAREDSYRSASDVINLGSVIFYREHESEVIDQGKKKNTKQADKKWIEVKKKLLCDLFLFKDDNEQAKINSAKETNKKWT